MLTVLSLLTSAITWVPSPERLELVVPGVCGVGALMMSGLAFGLSRLPAAHWVRQSRPVRAVLAAVAVTVTVLVAVLV